MPGFLISNMGAVVLDNCYNESCYQDHIEVDGFYCARNTIKKFHHDKCLYENDEYVILAEGVIFNKAELFDEYSCQRIEDLIMCLYERSGERYFDCFRGPFSGAIYDKAQRKWVIYTSHYGDNPVFYYHDEGGHFAFGSQVNYLLETLDSNNVSISLNEKAVYMMLSYAYMIDGSTYANEIKRLLPGSYAIVNSDGGITVKSYYRPKERTVDLSEWSTQSIIKEIDRLFRAADAREFAKDDEYGYSHLSDLSGGLDSRMTIWVAADLGHKGNTNITYCQSGYLDETVARQIARDLGNELVFYALDDAEFIYNVERIVEMDYGLGAYSGITGGEILLSSLNIDNYGIEHTGQLGDVVVGSFFSHGSSMAKIEHAGAYSEKMLTKLDELNAARYLDREQFLFEGRAFLGALSTHMIRRNYTEVGSPFLDVDLIEFCLSIPVEQRGNHKIYKEWIRTYYPKAGDYIWEKEGTRVNLPSLQNRINKFLNKVKRYVLRSVSNVASMNPFEYWYKTNPSIRCWIDNAVNKYGQKMPSDIRNEILAYFASATVLEKTQALTALCAYDYYFDNGYKKNN